VSSFGFVRGNHKWLRDFQRTVRICNLNTELRRLQGQQQTHPFA
jgi:hypothetical protein